MPTIKIAHLYYDLMNLYGENGNVKALTHHLKMQHIEVSTNLLTIEDKIDFNQYDIFYIGSGTKENWEITRQDIIKRKKEIQKAIEKKKFFFLTGNALDLFGENYCTLDNKKLETLNILDFEAVEIDFRIVGDTIAKHREMKEEIIGFQNRFSILKNVQEKELFQLAVGTGYYPKNHLEGIQKETIFGTYLLGPILIRNPHFNEYLIQKILKEKQIKYQKQEEEIERMAYQEYRKIDT